MIKKKVSRDEVSVMEMGLREEMEVEITGKRASKRVKE